MSHGTRSNIDPYHVLGVARDATDEQVKAAYRKKALENHPDRGGSTERMADINDAYAAIMAERSGASGGSTGAKPTNPYGKFRMADDGLWFLPPGVDDGEDDLFIRVTETRFSYDALLVDERNALTLVLGYAGQDGKAVQTEFSRGLLNDERRLVTHLETHGLDCAPLDDASKGLLAWYLKKVAKPRRTLKLVDRRGWLGGAFLFPTGEVFGADERFGYRLRQLMRGRAWGQQGRPLDWKTNVAALAVGNTRLGFALCVPFASTLLEFVGLDSGGFHFVGASSVGKSSILRAAASVAGRGERKDGLVLGWMGNAKGVSANAALFCDLPLILDELSRAPRKEVAAIVMDIAEGTGTLAATSRGGAREVPSWRTLLLSTGNVGLPEFVGGMPGFDPEAINVRLLHIPAEVRDGSAFERDHHFADGAALAKHLRLASARHYGTAIRAWLACLTAERNRDPDAFDAMLRAWMEAFAARHAPGATGAEARAADYFAVVALAGTLAARWGVLPWDGREAERSAVACLRAWEGWMAGRGADERRRVVQHFRRLVHTEEFVDLLNPGPRRPVVLFHEERRGEGRHHLVEKSFWPDACKGLNGVGPTDALRHLDEAGFLLRAQPRGFLHKKTPRGWGLQPKERPEFYVLKPSISG